MKLRALAVVVVLATLCAWFVPSSARALDYNIAGSAQVDYHLVPRGSAGDGTSNGAPRTAFDGFTLEGALKVSVDLSDHFSVNVKMCMGCHGLASDMLYMDYRVADELNIRAGRFSPSFGAFNLRHDPANHRLSDKPLAYDMGRMLRLRDWNMGVLPSPFPDTGLEVNGLHWFGNKIQVDYAAYAVTGFRADNGAADLDFARSRTDDIFYFDNNNRPTVGARVALTARLSKNADMQLGSSVMYGTFDPANKLTYLIYGADLGFRLNKTNLRFEYLARRQDLDVTDQSRFKYLSSPSADYFVKHGGFAELEVPLTSRFDLIGRGDFLARTGNVLKGSALQANSAILRYTIGTAFTIERGLRAKLSTEYWSFSDLDLAGRRNALSSHVALVGTF